MATLNNSTPNTTKPPKIVLKRVLEINDNLKLHLYGTQLILEAGLMLNIPQITISKAQIIYHRFYYKQNRNLTDYPPFHIAMTSTYLASKLDENTRRHRDVLTVFDRLYKKRNNTNQTHLRTIDPHGKRYTIWKENLFNFEIRVLAAMGFNCNITSTHKYLLQLLIDLLATETLAKHSWALLNDLHRLPNILDYDSVQIACACIFLSARRLKIKLPDDPCWNDLFGVDRYIMHEIGSIILELLELPKYAFKLANMYKEDDMTLDVNPQTVQQQMRVIHKRNLDKHKRMKAAKLKNKKSETAPIKSLHKEKVRITKLVTVPKPVLGLKNGENGKIKKINLNLMAKITTPNVSSSTSKSMKTIHFSSNKHQFESHTNDNNTNNKKVVADVLMKEKEKKEKKDRDRSRKAYKSRDRDRRYKRRKHHSNRHSGRRRKASPRSRRDDGSSSDSDYHTRHRRRRDRDRDRDRDRGRDRKRERRDRRDRSSSYSVSPDRRSSKSRSRSRSVKSDKSDNKRSRSRSKQIDRKKKDGLETSKNV